MVLKEEKVSVVEVIESVVGNLDGPIQVLSLLPLILLRE